VYRRFPFVYGRELQNQILEMMNGKPINWDMASKKNFIPGKKISRNGFALRGSSLAKGQERQMTSGDSRWVLSLFENPEMPQQPPEDKKDDEGGQTTAAELFGSPACSQSAQKFAHFASFSQEIDPVTPAQARLYRIVRMP
jgi:hypothetical protein